MWAGKRGMNGGEGRREGLYITVPPDVGIKNWKGRGGKGGWVRE